MLLCLREYADDALNLPEIDYDYGRMSGFSGAGCGFET